MKSRLGAMAALVTLSASLVATGASPAQAAGISARASQSVPIINEDVRVYGAAPKAGRVVQLQIIRSGRWSGVRSAHTSRSGSYTFTVRASSAAARYRVYAPKVKKVPAAASTTVTVHGVKPTVTFAPPVSVNGATISPASAMVSPARPGAAVRLLVKKGGGGYSTAATAKQSAAGVVKFAASVPTGSTSAPYRYQAQAVGRTVATSGSAQGLTLSSKALGDEFTGTTLSPQWQSRTQGYLPRRQCSKTADHMVTVAKSVATFKVKRNHDRTSAKCPYGTWDNPTIDSKTFTEPYGFYAAKIKFQQARGMHGAFWLQGGTEVDIAEHFGYHRPVSNLLHNGSENTGNFSVGGDQAQTRSILGRSTPYSGFHTYSVQWSPAGYVFQLDGVPTLVTSRKNTTKGAEIILSLQTSDWELPALKASTVATPSATMQVDWVRAYQ